MARSGRSDAKTQQDWQHYRGKENRNGDWVTDARYGVATEETAEPSKVEDEEEPLPTPICTYQYQMTKTYPDGRQEVSTVADPTCGLEHLFNRAPGTTDQLAPPRHTQVSRSTQRTSTPSLPSKRVTASKSVRRRPAKRTRTGHVARSSSRRQPVVTDPCSDGEDEDGAGDKGIDTMETSKSFRMGEIEGMKVFLKHRIDELTMKPVRGMVTAWVKQLEPRRPSTYGPYHKMKPRVAPADTYPPWWPKDVCYIEPAHLDKESLLTLAVEIMLQHRDLPIDEVKRACPGGWVAKLRAIAQYEIDKTPEDQFSSSKNIEFSRLMKERAVNSILPSLFEIAQSYEGYIFQHSLWQYKATDIPKGVTITWFPIARPAKQIAPRRRVRTDREARAPRDESDVDAHDDTSDDDTVVDEGMTRLADKMSCEAEARAVRARDAYTSAAPVEAPVAKVSSPVIPVCSPRPVTAMPAAPQPEPAMKSGNSSPVSSFDSPVGRRGYEDIKGRRFVADARQLHPELDQLTRYPGYPYTGHHMVQPGLFEQPSLPTYPPFPSASFMNPGPFHYLDNDFTMFGPSPASDMALNSPAYHQLSGNTFRATSHIPEYSAYSATSSFDGLPCDIGVDGLSPQQSFCSSYMPGQEALPGGFTGFGSFDAGPPPLN